MWGRAEASAPPSPKGKPIGSEVIGPGPVVLRSDPRILASLGAVCLLIGLICATGIAAMHAGSPHRWPAGVGWLYLLGALMALLGGAGFWFGFGTRWETRFDDAGITWVRPNRTRFTPWSLVGSVVVVRQASASGPTTSLSFRDREGRQFWACQVDRRHAPGSERILPLARVHLPALRVDPLADEAIRS